MRFSPDGRQIAVGLAGLKDLIRVRDLSTGESIAEFRRPQAIFLTWHPGGKALAVGCDDRNVYLYSIPSAEIVSVLEHRNIGLTTAFSPNRQPRGDQRLGVSGQDLESVHGRAGLEFPRERNARVPPRR